jgi:hypothetical protein
MTGNDMGNFIKALLCLVAMLILATNSGSVYAAVAGRVQFVHGKVQLTTATGVTHAVKKGDAVSEGDTLISMQSAFAQIRMVDGGIIAMRPDTKLKIDRFTFNGEEDGTERSFFSVFKGGFRAITGTIGKKNRVNYHITTPATTIGVRGTDHETFVVTQDSPLAARESLGTYNKVNLGETSMTTEKGTIFVLPNQMGFAGAADQMPELKPVNLDIFTVAAQPALESRGDKHEGNPEGDRDLGESAKSDKNEIRETSPIDNNGVHDATTIEKHEIRDIAPLDKIELQGSSTGAGGSEGTTTITPSTEDAVKNTIPTTPDSMLEQEH